MHSGTSDIPTLPGNATWMHNREQEPPAAEDLDPDASRWRHTPIVGQRTELARYTVAEGERILYGQRIDGIVRFLPDQRVVLESPSANDEDGRCCPRETLEYEGRPDAARQKRRNDADEEEAPNEHRPRRCGLTGDRVELARYVITAGERMVCGQRIFGVVRVVDLPVAGGGRSYLVERELEQDGYGALEALVADYLDVAQRLDTVPMSTSIL